MDLVLRSELRALWWRKGSVLSALAIVVLGVASVVAVHRLSVTVDASLASQTPPWLRGDTVLLTHPDLTPTRYAELRRAWRAGRFAGVTALLPLLSGELASSEGELVIVGIDPLAGSYQLAQPMRDSADGAVPAPAVQTGSDRVWASPQMPSRLSLQSALGATDLELSPVDNLPVDTLVTDIGQAERWLGGRASPFVLVQLDAPYGGLAAFAERLLPGISAALPDPGERLRDQWPTGWSSAAGDTQNALRQLGASIMFNLGALGTLAIVVAGFLLFQGAAVSRRRSELLRQRLAALGVSEGRTRRIFVGVGVIEGLLGGVLGTICGIALADALIASRLDGELVALADSMLWLKGIGLGLLVAVLARWLASAGPGPARLPVAALVGLLLAGLLLIDGSGLLGAFGGLLGLCVLAAAIVPAGFSLAAKLRPRALPLAARLGYAQLAAGRREMSAALVALALAVAASMSVTIMVESFRADLLRVLDQRLAAEAYLDISASRLASSLPRQAPTEADIRQALSTGAGEVSSEPGQVHVAGFGSVDARVGALPIELSYRRFDAWESSRYGLSSALASDEALVSERLTRELDLAVGDSLVVAVGGRQVELTVRGVFPGFGDVAPLALIDLVAASRLGVEVRFERFAIDGIDAQVVKDRLSAFGSVEAASDVRRLAEEQFDRTFAITDALTVVALLVAALGTVSALIALRLSQQQEIDLLHAIGTGRTTLTASELVRGLTLGGFASALALPLGLAMAWVLCAVVNPRAFGWSVGWQPTIDVVAPPLLLCVLMALLAALVPMLINPQSQARGDQARGDQR